jgi:hypothetical protein
VCVAAWRDAKKRITELWVEDSLQTGVMADADRASPASVLESIPQLT